MSENAEFSKNVTDLGVAWLGPSPNAVQDMGDKLTSKQLALKAGVNIIPGYDGPMKNVEHALEVANDMGYPVLLKAQSGGGGKGMRVCRSDEDIVEAFPMATEEGLKFFKDPRLLCEKYVSLHEWVSPICCCLLRNVSHFTLMLSYRSFIFIDCQSPSH